MLNGNWNYQALLPSIVFQNIVFLCVKNPLVGPKYLFYNATFESNFVQSVRQHKHYSYHYFISLILGRKKTKCFCRYLSRDGSLSDHWNAKLFFNIMDVESKLFTVIHLCMNKKMFCRICVVNSLHYISVQHLKQLNQYFCQFSDKMN